MGAFHKGRLWQSKPWGQLGGVCGRAAQGHSAVPTPQGAGCPCSRAQLHPWMAGRGDQPYHPHPSLPLLSLGTDNKGGDRC